MRLGEICALELSDLDVERKTISVNKSVRKINILNSHVTLFTKFKPVFSRGLRATLKKARVNYLYRHIWGLKRDNVFYLYFL